MPKRTNAITAAKSITRERSNARASVRSRSTTSATKSRSASGPQDSDPHQVTDREWLDVGTYRTHICCDCSLAHVIYYRLFEGRIQERWRRDDKKTRRLRRQAKRQ